MSDPCCDCSTCRLLSSSSCSAADACCDGNTCSLKAAGSVCRAATSSCDRVERCSGTSALCPKDEGELWGTACTASDGTASTCYGKVCLPSCWVKQIYFVLFCCSVEFLYRFSNGLELENENRHLLRFVRKRLFIASNCRAVKDRCLESAKGSTIVGLPISIHIRIYLETQQKSRPSTMGFSNLIISFRSSRSTGEVWMSSATTRPVARNRWPNGTCRRARRASTRGTGALDLGVAALATSCLTWKKMWTLRFFKELDSWIFFS